MKVGDIVVFVPSHDGEYNKQPGVGTVHQLLDEYVVILLNRETPPYSSISVRKDYVAAIYDSGDVLALVKKLNDRVLDLMHQMYVIDLRLDDAKRMIREKIVGAYHTN